MTDAPERIWASNGWTRNWHHEPFHGRFGVEYIRADLHDTRIAELEAEMAHLREVVACHYQRNGTAADVALDVLQGDRAALSPKETGHD